MILATCQHHNLKPYTFQSEFRIVYSCLVICICICLCLSHCHCANGKSERWKRKLNKIDISKLCETQIEKCKV